MTTREPGLGTVLEPFADWWGEPEHNITRAEMTPIQNPATALAALLSGDVDMINPVPIQDVQRLQGNPDVKVVQGIEARVMMLGFPHQAEALKYSAETEGNPFADARVRKAVAHAINVPAILRTIMRGPLPVRLVRLRFIDEVDGVVVVILSKLFAEQFRQYVCHFFIPFEFCYLSAFE